MCLIGAQRAPVLARDARDEHVGVIGGHRHHRQHVAGVGCDDDSRPAPDEAQRPFGDCLNSQVDRKQHGVARLRRRDRRHAFDAALGVLLQRAHARLAPQRGVERLLDLRHSHHIFLVVVELADVGFLIEAGRRPDVTQDVGSERAVQVVAHRLQRGVDPRQPQGVFGQTGQRGKIDLFQVGERHLIALPVVAPQARRAVVAHIRQLLQPRNDRLIDDLNDVRLLHATQHPPHPRFVVVDGHVAPGAAVPLHHGGQIEIDAVARPVLDQQLAVAIPDLAAHGRDAHGDLGRSAQFGQVILVADDLQVPQPGDQTGERDPHQGTQHVDPPEPQVDLIGRHGERNVVQSARRCARCSGSPTEDARSRKSR